MEWNIGIEGTLNNTNTGYTFNADGYQDFNIRLKADLDTNCDSQGFSNQNEAYKDYKIRVMKYKAPQFSDINYIHGSPEDLLTEMQTMRVKGHPATTVDQIMI